MSGRVAFLSHAVQMGGAEFSLAALAAELRRRGWSVAVVLPRDGPLASALRSAGVRVVISAWTAAAMAGRLRSFQPELIHSNSVWTLELGHRVAHLLGVPLVCHVRGYPRRSGRGPSYWRPLLRRAARVICVSRFIARRTARVLPRDRVDVVHNGVDLARFRPGLDGGAFRRRLGLEDGQPLVVLVARVTPWKGTEVFIRAAAIVAREFPRARFAVVGAPLFTSDAFLRKMRSLAARLGLSETVAFTGFEHDVPSVFAAADVAVTASRGEPFGRSTAEAMACGTPVVGIRSGATPEVIGKAGVLVGREGSTVLAGGILELLRNGENVKRLGREGRLRAERLFSLKRHVNGVEATYGRVLGR